MVKPAWLKPFDPLHVPDTREELYNWAFWKSCIAAGVYGVVYAAVKEPVRGYAGIAYEAFVGETMFASLARTAPVSAPLAAAVIGYHVFMKPESDFYIHPHTPLVEVPKTVKFGTYKTILKALT